MSFDLKINNGDLVIKNGQLQTVQDSEKLIQEILKICLTEIGSNPVNPGYGSFLSRTIIGSALDTSILVQIGKTQINSALENLKTLQDIQIKSLQKVSADELLAAVQNILVQRSQVDPTFFNIQISVLSKGLKPITTSFQLTTI